MKYIYYRNKILFFFLLLVAVLILNSKNIIAALHNRYYIYDPDGYMHMVIASDFLKNWDWHQHFNYRINTPFGADTHAWTQIITVLLVASTLVLNLFMPIAKALYLTSFVLPMLFNAVAAYAMIWAIKPLKPSPYQQLFVVLAFLLNPFLSRLFAPLNVDYDFLLITLSIFYWGCLLRFFESNQNSWAVLAAMVAALGLWTSISFIILVFISLMFIAWLLIIRKQLSITPLNIILIVLCVMLVFVIRLEHRYFFTISHDTVSIVHLTFFALIFLGVNLYNKIFNGDIIKSVRIIFIFAFLTIIFFTMNFLFPGFYYGPYNQVSPYLLKYFFPVVSEFRSPFGLNQSIALAIFSYFIIGINFYYYLYLDNKLNSLFLRLLLWATVVTMLPTLIMYRWSRLSIPLSILLVSFFVSYVCNNRINRFIKLIIIAVMTLIPSLILLTEKEIKLTYFQCWKQFQVILTDNFLNHPQFSRDKTLFIHSNYGPLILYYTPYSIVATNDHHNPEGLKDSFNFFKINEAGAKEIVDKRKIDLILLCEDAHMTKFNPNQAAWLQPIQLPEKYSLWRLYRVTHH